MYTVSVSSQKIEQIAADNRRSEAELAKELDRGRKRKEKKKNDAASVR